MFIDILLLLVIITCTYTDLTQRKIYNFVLLPVIILAFCYHIYTSGLVGLILSLKGLSLGLGLLFIPYLMGGIGAGDVKLMATIGALKGTSFIFFTCLAGAIAGGIISAIYLAKNKRLIYTMKKFFLPFLRQYGFCLNQINDLEKLDNSASIPYGAAIAAGTIAAYFVR